MAYVYRYVDKNDDVIKYVGLSKDYETLMNRIRAHTKDEWHDAGDWQIQYIECNNMAEADALETHFINTYETGKYFNKAKVGKGSLGFAPEVEWKDLYNLPNRTGFDAFRLETIELEAQFDSMKERLDRLYNEMWHFADEERKKKRNSVRTFFRTMFFVVYHPRELQPGWYSFSDVFAVYSRTDWEPDRYQSYTFSDVNDFIDAALDCADLRPFIKDDGFRGVRARLDPEVIEYERKQEECAAMCLSKFITV